MAFIARRIGSGVIVAGLIGACGPSAGGPVDGTTGGPESSGASTDATSNVEPMTGGHDGGSSSGAGSSEGADSTTGPAEEPLQCFDDGDPRDETCCPELRSPCPVVQHACEAGDCGDAPFAGAVLDVAAAQCMLAAVAGGSPAVLEQRTPWGLGESARRWLVGTPGHVVRVDSTLQDFSFGSTIELCQIERPAYFEACAAERDPQVLADCLRDAFTSCEPGRETATCPR